MKTEDRPNELAPQIAQGAARRLTLVAAIAPVLAAGAGPDAVGASGTRSRFFYTPVAGRQGQPRRPAAPSSWAGWCGWAA